MCEMKVMFSLHKSSKEELRNALRLSPPQWLKALGILQRFELNAKWQVDYYSLSRRLYTHTQQRDERGGLSAVRFVWP